MGYLHIPLTERAKENREFSTSEGSFQYKQKLLGLHGAPALFQIMMYKTLRPHCRNVTAYSDNVVLHCPDWKSHLSCVQAVVDSHRKAVLTINSQKVCHRVGRGQIPGLHHWSGVHKVSD